ncbi:GAF domain-containing protein [Arthrobacter caoxuetaonis]|uniref:GAF domain-containing protein n=1 Tax=Arthrobacter caoxuetaonis TaxID=2886935 RepID=A0A9X1MCF3_9MICC|nr:GAF domain-containing protein [Arthrobacter caoxuetaonis]MCC3296452.1 GAF domain-containing protein [Arthrobacter caoxuetaonis]USQ56714.1 GAF domain-containing protein [Arthrobacter caoxuetaonis]
MQHTRSAVHGRKPRTAESLQQDAWLAHESLRTQGRVLDVLRPGVLESWQRSLSHLPDPDAAAPALVFDGDELAVYRASHPLASIMPVIQRLLVDPGKDSGLLVAVGDQLGRLLWVDGDPELLRRAEGMMFMPGTDWSENSIGTSAPGTALVTGHSVQIAGAEHFSPQVHPWSCTAVPVHDPDSGSVLGVVDITGKEEAVAVHTLALVEAAVAAATTQLRVERLQSQQRPQGRRNSTAREPRPGLYQDSLQILGTDAAVLCVDGTRLQLSLRHSELMTLLALHPRGLTAEELAVLAYPEEASVGSVRAEMLRLRKLLSRSASARIVPESRPYRLPADLVLDAGQVRACLSRGAHRLALNIYKGPVLPHSLAPGIVELRRRLGAELREAVLSEAGVETVLQYLKLDEAMDDAEAWRLALQLLPRRSPRRAAIVAGLQRIERDLA